MTMFSLSVEEFDLFFQAGPRLLSVWRRGRTDQGRTDYYILSVSCLCAHAHTTSVCGVSAEEKGVVITCTDFFSLEFSSIE